MKANRATLKLSYIDDYLKKLFRYSYSLNGSASKTLKKSCTNIGQMFAYDKC